VPITIVPNSRQPNVKVSSRKVPGPNGADFLAPIPAANAIGAMIERKRLIIITKPVAMSHGIAMGAGLWIVMEAVDHSQCVEYRAVIR
jgi:hypothetical protein